MAGGFPEDAGFRYGTRDPETGVAWCWVSRAAAHAHPKGQLGAVEYLIVTYFLLAAAIKGWMIFGLGASGWTVPVVGILQLVTAAGLLARVPAALALAALQLVLTVVNGVGAFSVGHAYGPLIEVVLAIGIVAYLFEGERPNLIYRYRFQSRRGLDQSDTGEV